MINPHICMYEMLGQAKCRPHVGEVIIQHNFICRFGNLISARLAIDVSHVLRFQDQFYSPNTPPPPLTPTHQVFQGEKIKKKGCDIFWCLQGMHFDFLFSKASQLAILKNCFFLLSRIGFFLHPHCCEL